MLLSAEHALRFARHETARFMKKARAKVEATETEEEQALGACARCARPGPRARSPMVVELESFGAEAILFAQEESRRFYEREERLANRSWIDLPFPQRLPPKQKQVPSDKIAPETPGEVPGLIPVWRMQCPWSPAEVTTTIFVTDDPAASKGAGTPASPWNFTQAREFLGDETSAASGVRILFRAGGKWNPTEFGTDVDGNFLTIRASGTGPDANALFLGIYDRSGKKKATFNGQYDTLKTPVDNGIVIKGARYVQIMGIEVVRFKEGIQIISAENAAGEFVGARSIKILNSRVHHNYMRGIYISSALDGAGYGLNIVPSGSTNYVEPYPTNAKYPSRTITANEWWVEDVCVENCLIYSNGDGSHTGEANINITSHAAYVTIRHNRIYGETSTVIPGGGVSTGASFGTDGITFEGAGPGHIVEYNEIYDHQTLSASGSSEDGDGIDIKDTWNRTYYNSTGDLEDIVSVVVRNNVITGNSSYGIVIHQGAKYLHIYNNEISNNLDNEYTVLIKSGAALYDQMDGREYDVTYTGWGPGLVEKIYFYRNLVVGNAVNGITIRQEEEAYHGSFDDIQIVNNTVADNSAGYGLSVLINDYSSSTTVLDASSYYMNNIVLANNIYASNRSAPKVSDAGIQVKVYDGFYSTVDPDRGFLGGTSPSLVAQNNGFYNGTVTSDLIEIQGRNSSLSYVQTTYSTLSLESGSVEDSLTPFISGSYEASTSSVCVDAGSDAVGPLYYDTSTRVPDAPDYVGISTTDTGTPPDIGAYEVV